MFFRRRATENAVTAGFDAPDSTLVGSPIATPQPPPTNANTERLRRLIRSSARTNRWSAFQALGAVTASRSRSATAGTYSAQLGPNGTPTCDRVDVRGSGDDRR
jgi:hypothetical protein